MDSWVAKKNSVIFIFLLLFCLIGFSPRQQIFAFNKINIWVYSLKNLEKDLATNADSITSCSGELCNWYQVKSADDTIIRDFIHALQTKDTKVAAQIINEIPYDKNWNNAYRVLPFVCRSCFSQLLWVIPFYNGLLGVQNEWNGDATYKFFYLRIYKNHIIKIAMDWSLILNSELPDADNKNTLAKAILEWVSWSWKTINTISLQVQCKKYDSDVYVTCNYTDAFRKNLFWLQPNEGLDARKTSFQKKIKAIKAFEK